MPISAYLILLCLLLISFIGGTAVGRLRAHAGRWLVVNQAPVRSDVIIVLGGGPVERVQVAAQLWHRGYAATMLLTGGCLRGHRASQAQTMACQAEHLGVPRVAMLLEDQSRSTLENAQRTLPVLVNHGLTTALVVSSDYHMRRVGILFDRVYRGHGIRLTYVAARDPAFSYPRWWSTAPSRRLTVSEYAKLVVNWATLPR